MTDKKHQPRKVVIEKNRQKPVQTFRLASQLISIAVCLWIGIEFSIFIHHLENFKAGELYYRPPGVEGFLPISALMSLFYFLKTGIVHPVHPAGFFIFMGILGMSFVIGKSFCSWICPIGFLSEYTGAFGSKLFKDKLRMPKLLDYPLRSMKYLLLGFFSVSIFSMTAAELQMFLYSDYNTIADIKLFEFFRNITPTAFYTVMTLFVLSILFRNFWCRYLCPYGALLGIVGIVSPQKITRNEQSCIDCSLCDKACPSMIPVSKRKKVISDECTGCMQCIDACPVKDTLDYKSIGLKKALPKKIAAALLLFVFLIVLAFGMVRKTWDNKIPAATYKELYDEREAVSH